MPIELDDITLQRLYAWIDEIPLSRPKKNIARDFSDGILTAEVINFYFPKLVHMHNYSAANSTKQKYYNWNTLNKKVLRKLHITLSNEEMDNLVQCRSGAVERLLVILQLRIANYKERKASSPHTDYNRAASVQSIEKDTALRDTQFTTQCEPEISNNETRQVNSQNSEITNIQMQEKDQVIEELRETVQILENKVQKLEQLVRLKDGKIQTLVAKLQHKKST